ncbi:MAG: LysR family glycine cleavage system transcriptional activator [Pseudorhodobacter sp.]|jgi:LysR family glycine cleavage system transcriptional activator
MRDNLPPLTALRAFEAAARHLSFANAAAELHVSPAALSFQIKALEDHLGEPLFRRLHRAVVLTEAGRALEPGLREGFGALQKAWTAARRSRASRTLTITAGPTFTAKWLAPRFYDFARAHPEIDLRFSASLRFVDFAVDDVDVAIRYSTQVDPALFSHTLFTEWVTPMMAPSIAARCQTPQDLLAETLLHQDDVVLINPTINWNSWFAAAGLPGPTVAGVRFSQSEHAIDAAISGAGVVLARASLAQLAIRTGQLVAPFALALKIPTQCRFICAIGTETRPDIAAFFDWIKSEAQTMLAFCEGREFVVIDDRER